MKQTSGQSVKNSSKAHAGPSFFAPSIGSGQSKDFAFELTVSDRFGESYSDSVTITVRTVNNNPTANAGSDKTVDEQTKVTLSGFGKDPNRDQLSYEWSQVGGEP